jgi:hypothetical protein
MATRAVKKAPAKSFAGAFWLLRRMLYLDFFAVFLFV